MSKASESLEDTLNRVYNYGFNSGAMDFKKPNEMYIPEAKQLIARAVEEIIGEDGEWQDGNDFDEVVERNNLRAEQRKALAIWLGKKSV